MLKTMEIEARGLRFTADVSGPEAGVGVLFLHGFPNSRHSWGAQIEACAAAGYRCVAPDQRGYSPGARPDDISDYAVEEIVADAIGVADACGWDRFHLVGHDWGGQIAWVTALTHPDRLLSLSVLSRPHPAAFARAMESDAAQAGRSRHHKAFQDPGMADRLLENDAEPLRNTLVFENASGLFGPGDGKAGKRRMSDAVAGGHLSVLRDREGLNAALNWYRAAFQGQSTLARPDMPNVTVPTLYAWGTEDMSVGRAAAEGTQSCVDAAYDFLEIEGAGHFLAEEVPDRISTALLSHFGRN